LADLPEKGKNIDFLHQIGHISAQDRARTFNESSLKSSDSALSRGAIHIQSEADLVQKVGFFFKKSRILKSRVK